MHTHIKISADLARYNHINKKLIDMYHDASQRAGMSSSMFDIFFVFHCGNGRWLPSEGYLSGLLYSQTDRSFFHSKNG